MHPALTLKAVIGERAIEYEERTFDAEQMEHYESYQMGIFSGTGFVACSNTAWKFRTSPSNI